METVITRDPTCAAGAVRAAATISGRRRIAQRDGEPPHIEAIARDVTERHLIVARLRHQAFHDALTGLPNRALLLDRLRRALVRGKRFGCETTVLLLDLDDFKLVNDTLGHAVGDELLVELAGRLRSAVRGSETLTRLGGDEFAVVAEGALSDPGPVVLAERIMAVFADPFTVGNVARHLTASLGIAATGNGSDATDLLRDADTALYRVKSSGKAGYELFDVELRAEVVRRFELGEALDDALTAGGLEVHYQPIVSFRSGRIRAVEALVRVVWTNDAEVAPVERGDAGGPEALGDHDQTGVGATESQIGVRLDQFGDPSSVGGRERFDLDLTCGDGAEETRFRGCTDLSTDQVGGLGDDQGRCDERPGTVDRLHRL